MKLDIFEMMDEVAETLSTAAADFVQDSVGLTEQERAKIRKEWDAAWDEAMQDPDTAVAYRQQMIALGFTPDELVAYQVGRMQRQSHRRN